MVAPDGHAKCFIRPASGSSTVTVYSVANLPLPTQAAAGAPIKFKDINYTKYVVDEAEVEVAPATSTAPATFDRPLIADLPLEKGAASGTLTIGKSLDISFAPTTNNNPAFHMLVDGGAIPFDAPDTSRAASFQMLAGSYQWHYVDSSDTQSSGDLTIDNTGAVTGNEYITNAAQPCTFSGKMSVPDGKVNVYPGTITRDCPSETPPEMTLDVLASIFNDGSAPSRLLVVATGGDRKIGLPGGGSK
ncbi:MAG TPA: hypothetical protein VFQ88_04225 [Nevskiaceae bacterium]|nr:hypothetical protein [Nevskiaceae bacterium]